MVTGLPSLTNAHFASACARSGEVGGSDALREPLYASQGNGHIVPRVRAAPHTFAVPFFPSHTLWKATDFLKHRIKLRSSWYWPANIGFSLGE